MAVGWYSSVVVVDCKPAAAAAEEDNKLAVAVADKVVNLVRSMLAVENNVDWDL